MDKETGPADMSRQPRSLTERLEAEAKAHAAEMEVPAPSSMAERFAPEAQPAAGPGRRRRASASGRISVPTQASAPLVSRTLLALLVVLSLIPSLALVALYWQALAVPAWMPIPESLSVNETAPPRLDNAIAAGIVPTETVLAKRDIERPAVTLSLASGLVGDAGKRVAFPIGLDSVDRLPLRSILTIGGLPSGASLSAGRPYGETEWSLRPDEIGDLSLTLPEGASGKHAVTVELIAGDGTSIANGATSLEIVPDPKAALILRPEEAARIEELIAHGHKMIEVGYFAGARGYFKRAAEAGSAEAALALGATYDPSFIAEIGAQGIPPDRAEARLWYERAGTLGNSLADARIAALEQMPVAQQGDGSLEPAAEPQAPEPETETEWVEVSGSVHMRAEPMPKAKTIKIAEPGMRYKATGRKAGWARSPIRRRSRSAGSIPGSSRQRQHHRLSESQATRAAVFLSSAGRPPLAACRQISAASRSEVA
jgi:hypothetical protein